MAEYVGVIAFFLCIIHFIYQAIVLPSVRQSARDDLFQLRDQLRTRLIETQGNSNKNTLLAFKMIDDGINRSLNRLHLLSFSSMIRAIIKVQKSPERFRKSRDDFDTVLSNSEDETPKLVYEEMNKVLHHVLTMNSLMFALYLLPFVILITLVKSTYKKLKDGTDVLVATCIGKDRLTA